VRRIPARITDERHKRRRYSRGVTPSICRPLDRCGRLETLQAAAMSVREAHSYLIRFLRTLQSQLQQMTVRRMSGYRREHPQKVRTAVSDCAGQSLRVKFCAQIMHSFHHA
jgi:hypothetical protein